MPESMVTVHVHNGIDYRVNTEGRCRWHSCVNNVYNSFDEPEEIKVMRTITLNKDDMGCDHSSDERFTCGTCNASWCGICNPTPSTRCPYEYDHERSDSVELLLDGEYVEFFPVFSPREIWDIHNEGFLDEDNANRPCPVCGDSGGFHLDDKHRNVDPKYLLEKGWHNE